MEPRLITAWQIDPAHIPNKNLNIGSSRVLLK